MAREDNVEPGRFPANACPLLAHFRAGGRIGCLHKEISLGFLPILILLFIVMWFLVIRPQRKRQQEQRRVMDNLEPGQEIMTAGGLYGTISTVVDDEEVMVEIAPDVRVRVARRAIALVVTEEDDELEELERAQREAEEQVLAAREADR
jgi:preprotein translocase subunit YajC